MTFFHLLLFCCHLVPEPEPCLMNNESTDLPSLPGCLRQWPGAAPLKNEKAGFFCCPQISPVLKNPIKRQRKVTFSFSLMTHRKKCLSGRRLGAADEGFEGVRVRGEKDSLIDWGSTASGVLCQSQWGTFLSCSLFWWPPVITYFRTAPCRAPSLI